jgi:threonine/homoserine/homoserine lactone efflux protein
VADVGVTGPAAAFGLGIALGASPGPVQLLLFSEASRGGLGRGLRAMVGANATFGIMLLVLAAGLSSLQPAEPFLRVVQVAVDAFLLFLAVDAVRESRRPSVIDAAGPRTHPSTRGVVAVILNPGVYVFLATTRRRGRPESRVRDGCRAPFRRVADGLRDGAARRRRASRQ